MSEGRKLMPGQVGPTSILGHGTPVELYSHPPGKGSNAGEDAAGLVAMLI